MEEGQTVYWTPLLNSEGQPMEGSGLRYCYDAGPQGQTRRWEETLSLRAAMDYASMYGGVTYGVSNNWLGAASSASYASYITVDSGTGELVVKCLQEPDSTPYLIQPDVGAAGSVFGTTEPGADRSAQGEQLTLEKVKELAAEKGGDLSWNDFEPYRNEGDIGSGLHILAYDIDERCCLLIGGTDKQLPPMYIRLVSKADDSVSIDIRTESIDEFISSISQY